MNLLSLEDEKFKTVEIKGYKFKIRAMFPRDKVMIAQRRMKLQDGQPIEALTDGDFVFFENIAMIDICTEEMPKDIKSNESCLNWPDQELINLLSAEIRKHTSNIEEALKKNRPID
jgi:hypothetical protein